MNKGSIFISDVVDKHPGAIGESHARIGCIILDQKRYSRERPEIAYRLVSELSCFIKISAKSYYGSELKVRGVPVNVSDKSEVFEQSMKMAKNLASKSRLALTTLKRHLNKEILRELPGYIKEELLMHQETLYQPSVLSKIKNSYI